MNNKGQSVLSEHVMVFFVVIAAIVAMSTYVQRGFEARIHDERNFMVNAVSSACDANCQLAAGGNIYDEYEPYYLQQFSDVTQNEADYKGQTKGNANALGSIYYNAFNETTGSSSISGQLPPECAGANPPSYCANL